MNSGEIDKKQLKVIQNRFTQLSEARLKKMLDSFNHTKSDAIRLLPLLFHVNHPMLPGYVDKSTPCGLPNYFPTQLEKKIAKTVSRSFKLKTRAYLKFEIAALYLMGSTGTLGQSLNSDIDLWVCLSEYPEAPQFEKLTQKVEKISQWFAEIGIELNSYLVHQDDFKQQRPKKLTKESCGDTQNFLLLDEFYRTAIWLCGRMPLWWLIPPNENYTDYSELLVKQRKIDQVDWIDFGEIKQIPASEYFSAALWQLYKAIESPFKSSIKLLMLEIYVGQFPQVTILSEQYKSSVYQGIEDIDSLDPYLMMLHNAEAYLMSHPERLEFLRRAFYLKAGSKVTLGKINKRNWRYQKILQLVNHWGWNQARLNYLNNRHNWRVNSVIKERKDLVRELVHSYHFLANFSRAHQELAQKDKEELVFLGRKIYSIFERKSGKIDCINHGIAKDIGEPWLTLFYKESKEWCLLLGAVNPNELLIHQIVYRAETFFEVLAWCVCNKVITEKSSFQVYSDSHRYDRKLATFMSKSISLMIKNTQKQLNARVLEKNEHIIMLGIFFDNESDPVFQEKQNGFYSVADSQNLFCWGENSVNLLSQFDIFYINSWGEYHCRHYQGESAWLQLFLEYRSLLTTDADKLSIFSTNTGNNIEIKKQIEYLFSTWEKLRSNSTNQDKNYCYLMSLSKGFLKIDFNNGQVNCKYFKQAKRFLHALSETDYNERLLEQPGEPSIKYTINDNLCLSTPLKKIITKNLQVEHRCYFIQHDNHHFEVMLTQPNGQLFYQTHSGLKLDQLVSHYQQFFDSISHRLGWLPQGIEIGNFWHTQLNTKTNQSSERFRRLKLDKIQVSDFFYRVQAIATTNSENKLCYNLFSGDQAYYYRDFGDLVYRKMVQHILKQRDNQHNYPIFITDLDLSVLNQQTSVSQYLTYKRNIEQKLNRALSQLK